MPAEQDFDAEDFSDPLAGLLMASLRVTSPRRLEASALVAVTT